MSHPCETVNKITESACLGFQMKIKSVHISEIHMNLCLCGYFCQVHPLGLCNTSEDGDLYEYGWVGVVRLTPPDALNKPCFTLFEKVWYTSILELRTTGVSMETSNR